MKKTLIELMLEANVKWPEGAEFAAQDKDYLNVDFYEEKPKKIKNRDYWADNGNPVLSIEFESLCRNWHQTIVTRSEYEAARGERYAEITTPLGKVNKTTEQKIKDMVFHQEIIARYQEQIEANQVIVDRLRADLAALGWSEQPAGNTEKLKITDWCDLKVGDIVGMDGTDNEYTVVDKEDSDYVFSRPVEIGREIDFSIWPEDLPKRFKFIRRPTK